jgi:hypothetical protein
VVEVSVGGGIDCGTEPERDCGGCNGTCCSCCDWGALASAPELEKGHQLIVGVVCTVVCVGICFEEKFWRTTERGMGEQICCVWCKRERRRS